jgi:hypothetical protein
MQELDEIESWAKSITNLNIEDEISNFSSHVQTKCKDPKYTETHGDFDLFEEIKTDQVEIDVKTLENAESKNGSVYQSYASQYS